MELLDAAGRKIEGVYRIDPNGSVTRIITHEVDRPNGLVVTPDDRFLIVADNNNNSVGGARKLWRFELDDGGDVDLSSQTLLLDWKSGRGPDGMVLDQKGRMYVAGGRNKPQKLIRRMLDKEPDRIANACVFREVPPLVGVKA